MNLISFEPEQIQEVIKLLGIELGEDGYIGKCASCGMKLGVWEIGTIAKGKEGPIFYCEDADCFARQLTHDYLNDASKQEGVTQ